MTNITLLAKVSKEIMWKLTLKHFVKLKISMRKCVILSEKHVVRGSIRNPLLSILFSAYFFFAFFHSQLSRFRIFYNLHYDREYHKRWFQFSSLTLFLLKLKETRCSPWLKFDVETIYIFPGKRIQSFFRHGSCKEEN